MYKISDPFICLESYRIYRGMWTYGLVQDTHLDQFNKTIQKIKEIRKKETGCKIKNRKSKIHQID